MQKQNVTINYYCEVEVLHYFT